MYLPNCKRDSASSITLGRHTRTPAHRMGLQICFGHCEQQISGIAHGREGANQARPAGLIIKIEKAQASIDHTPPSLASYKNRKDTCPSPSDADRMAQHTQCFLGSLHHSSKHIGTIMPLLGLRHQQPLVLPRPNQVFFTKKTSPEEGGIKNM